MDDSESSEKDQSENSDFSYCELSVSGSDSSSDFYGSTDDETSPYNDLQEDRKFCKIDVRKSSTRPA